MNVLEIKITGLCILFVGNLLLSLLPLKLIPYLQFREAFHPRFHTILGLINCFTGGVFFGTFLIHLLPETIDDFNSMLNKWNIDSSFPIAEFTIGIGFFVVLLTENIFGLYHQYRSNGNNQPRRRKSVNVKTPLLSPNGETAENEENHLPEVSISSSLDTLEEEGIIRAAIFFLSLSLHSILAGLAIGLQTTTNEVITLFVAIDGHKWVIAFALGVEFMHVSMSMCKRIMYMTVFAFMTPIGIVIGICVDTANRDFLARITASAILQSIATGTFLYVTFFEVLNKEFSNGHDLLRVLFVIIGFGVMVAFKFLDVG